MDVKYFSMFDGGLPHDCMHDILGVTALEIKLLMSYYISSKYLSLDDYNKWLVKFNFGYTETDKHIPLVIQVCKTKGHKIICFPNAYFDEKLAFLNW